jgi:hypothetical protein
MIVGKERERPAAEAEERKLRREMDMPPVCRITARRNKSFPDAKPSSEADPQIRCFRSDLPEPGISAPDHFSVQVHLVENGAVELGDRFALRTNVAISSNPPTGISGQKNRDIVSP